MTLSMSFLPSTKVICIGGMILGNNSLILGTINLVITLYTILHKLIGMKLPRQSAPSLFGMRLMRVLLRCLGTLPFPKTFYTDLIINSLASSQKH